MKWRVIFVLAIASLVYFEARAEVTLPPAMVCSSPPPPGTGLREDGKGAIHFPWTGTYIFFGGVVNSSDTLQFHQGGGYGWVTKTWSGPLEWIRPDGVREKVPTIYLYPPFG